MLKVYECQKVIVNICKIAKQFFLIRTNFIKKIIKSEYKKYLDLSI